MSRDRAVLVWELTGAVFMMLIGAALHFAFHWSGGWRPLALMAAVNESIWEHLKLAFWPGVIWAVLPLRPAAVPLSRAFAAKGISLLLTSGMIVTVFLSYTHILGRNVLVLDIGTFALAILVGQIVSFCLVRGALRREIVRAGLALLGVQLCAFALFTYLPPDHWLFTEARSGLRGISPG